MGFKESPPRISAIWRPWPQPWSHESSGPSSGEAMVGRKPAAERLRPIVGGLAASSWVAFDPIPAAVKFAATGVQFVLNKPQGGPR